MRELKCHCTGGPDLELVAVAPAIASHTPFGFRSSWKPKVAPLNRFFSNNTVRAPFASRRTVASAGQKSRHIDIRCFYRLKSDRIPTLTENIHSATRSSREATRQTSDEALIGGFSMAPKPSKKAVTCHTTTVTTTSKYFTRTASSRNQRFASCGMAGMATTAVLAASPSSVAALAASSPRKGESSPTRKTAKRTSSFQAVTSANFSKMEEVKPHTLIVGTHPSIASLSENQYFGHPVKCVFDSNKLVPRRRISHVGYSAFWWIAGDCLGFRRAPAIADANACPMAIAAIPNIGNSRWCSSWSACMGLFSVNRSSQTVSVYSYN